ncbi:DUF5977 domain-containing protein [Pseudoflavitalea rhizosphaerae]|uniref:DUF5977 domain-containing protein n=1 Tax=Pseudoflavitalea rhizosphaerae TaxID=1884793 RepID=UPI000F8C5B86|nr:DUF5977 domain-containing protein [Pseudoflavitalea rhizosphaerae]
MFNKSFYLVGLITFLTISNLVQGQQSVKFGSVIPPSPNAAAIERFGETPVDLFTGIPDINVPLFKYEGSTNKLKLNVALRYHAGGVRVADVASNVGLGWALNAGGVISRTIYGLADFNPLGSSFPTSDTLPDGSGPVMKVRGCTQWFSVGSYAGHSDNLPCNGQPDCIENVSEFYKIVDLYKGVFDGQFDVFSYSFEGYSGKFIIGKNDSILQMPQTNLRISRIAGYNLPGFIITTPVGAQYVFKDQEFNNYEIKTCSWQAVNPLGCPLGGFNKDVSSWYLTKVYSPSGTDSMSFTYEGAVLRYQADMGESFYYGPIGSPLNTYSKSTAYHGDVGGYIPNEMRVRTVKLPNNTSIEFEYDSEIARLDMDINGNPRALKKIIVKNNNNPVCQYQLFHSYFGTSGRVAYDAARTNDYYNRRLVLDSIRKVSGSQILPLYKFGYESNPPGRFSNAQDHWGFYNGETGNTTLIPAQYLLTANRSSSQYYAKNGTLNKITYPTGGTTSFEYETNFGSIGYVGGIRVAKTIDFDGISHVNDITTEYTYSLATATSPMYVYGFAMRDELTGLTYSQAYSSFSNVTLGQVRGSPATYDEVTVSRIRGTTKLGKVVSNFQNEGRTLYNGGFDPEYVKGYPYLPIPYLDWADGLIKRQRYYDDQDNLLKEVTYDYDIKKIKVKSPYFKAMKVATLAGPYECGSGFCNSDCHISLITSPTGQKNEEDYVIYTRRNYYPYTGRTDLIRTTEIVYSGGGNSITTETNFTYHGTYFLPVKKIVVNSKNEALKTSFKYPFDFLSTTVYQSMFQRNMISPVVEQRDSIDNNLLQFTRTNYSNTTGNVFVPGSIESNLKNFPLETLLKFNLYDKKGNILERQSATNVKEVFVWGYNAQYPVAKIIGSDWNTVKSLFDTSILNNGSESQIITQLTNLRAALNSNPLVQIETYLFNPLSGITRATDIKGLNTYYEYDLFNRLHLVKDHNGNILKRICYNYAGEVEDCGMPVFTNQEQSGFFTRDNCGAGYTGNGVTYTVPAGTHASTISQAYANQLAIDDVNANGQNFANANGSCIQVCGINMANGYSAQMVNVTKSGSTVTFNWVFSSTSLMYPLTTYTIGILNGCKPAQNTTFTYTIAGRTYQIIFEQTGIITGRITAGTALPIGQTLYLSGSYTGM